MKAFLLQPGIKGLSLKFPIVQASRDCNWDVVFLGRNKSLI